MLPGGGVQLIEAEGAGGGVAQAVEEPYSQRQIPDSFNQPRGADEGDSNEDFDDPE
jgi:hypothetical protein